MKGILSTTKSKIKNKIKRMLGTHGYNISYSYDNDFIDIMDELETKYGNEIFAIQGIASHHLDLAQYSRSFYNKSGSKSLDNVANNTVDPNANVKEKNIVQYNHESNKASMRLNSLYLIYKDYKEQYNKKEAKEVLEDIISGTIFINDLHHWQMSYCYSIDTRIMISEGIQFIKSGVNIKPPKRLDSFSHLLIQAIGAISNQIAGAVTIPDYFILFDYFARKDLGNDYLDKIENGDTNIEHKIKNYFQNFIYSICIPLFRVSQSPFVNISIMDRGFMDTMFSGYMIPNPNDPTTFHEPDFDSTYRLQKMFFEYFNEINMKEGVFTFPVVTLAISLDDNNEYIDNDFAKWSAKFNHVKSLSNIYQGPPTSLSSCCRMRSDTTKVSKEDYQNSFGVAGLNVGSTRVCGLNLPKYAQIENKDPKAADLLIEKVHRILLIHRKLIKERADQGFLPLYNHNWIHLSRQYSTFGFIGGYEYVDTKGLDIRNDDGQQALINLLKNIDNRINTWREEEKDLHSTYNIEQIPGESVAVRLAKIDYITGYNKDEYGNMKYQIYSNQYIPPNQNASLYDRIRIQGVFDKHTSGGAILHINVEDESQLTEEQFFEIMNKARELGVIYFAINYAFSECSNEEDKHIVTGRHYTCPICNSHITNQYTRVVGFITPTNSWIKERQKYDYPDRHFYHNDEIDNILM